MKKLGCLIFSVLGFLMLVGLIVKDKNKENTAPSEVSSVAGSVASIEVSPPVKPLEVSTAQLLKDYSANEVRADGLYKDRLVQVTGTVEGVSKGPFGGMYLVLDVASSALMGVSCDLKDGQEKKAAELNKGQRVKVRGVVSGMTVMQVGLNDCEVAE